MSETPPLLLDTHAWLWLMNGDDNKLSLACRECIDAAAKTGKLLVSAISVWEVGMLEAKGRIQLNKTCLLWIKEALSAPGIQLAQLSPEIVIESSRLPGDFHGDPADRILIATARVHGATLLTQDSKILDYASLHYVSSMKV